MGEEGVTNIRMIMMPSSAFCRLWVLCSSGRWATASVMTRSFFFWYNKHILLRSLPFDYADQGRMS